MGWISTNVALPKEGKEVLTKINDEHGARNERVLVRKGRLWFVDTALSMYVYYQPTHWRRNTPAET